MAVPSNWKKMSLARRLDQLAEHFYSDGTAGTKNGSTVTATEYLCGPLHKTVLTLTATPITVTDVASTCQYGGVKLYDLPAGAIMFLGATVDTDVTLGVTGTFIDNWTGLFALGSATAAGDATLTSTEATWMKSVSISAATAKVGTANGQCVATQVTESGATWFDGTTTAGDIYYNLIVTDDATHTTGTGTISGTVTFHWINLGDY